MSVETQFVSVPIFNKDGFSLDSVCNHCDGCLTLEHYLWKLLGLKFKPDISVTSLRSRVRNKKGFLESAVRLWDESTEI